MLGQLKAPTEDRSQSDSTPPPPQPVFDLARYRVFPPAARNRELKKAVTQFASSGRDIFVHHVDPILAFRRTMLISSASTKKRYPKTAAQLWPILDQEQTFFWNEAALELRRNIRQGLVTLEECIQHHGLVRERDNYRWWAELAVATYLQLPLPEKRDDAGELQADEDTTPNNGLMAPEVRESEKPLSLPISSTSHKNDTKSATDLADITVEVEHVSISDTDSDDTEQYQLLDTLPDSFTVEPRMLYSHFAHYDLNTVRKAEGKHQIAMLRQLADLLHKSGKTLFYYYAYPHICRRTDPPVAGETVASEAADFWRFLEGSMRNRWTCESQRVKKLLGDGNMEGLVNFELESRDPSVLRLHEMVKDAMQAHGARSTNVGEM